MYVTFIYYSLQKNTIAELKRRTIGVSVLPDVTSNVLPIPKPLGLHNMDLPDIEIPELPDETLTSTSGAPANPGASTSNTDDYVTPPRYGNTPPSKGFGGHM